MRHFALINRIHHRKTHRTRNRNRQALKPWAIFIQRGFHGCDRCDEQVDGTGAEDSDFDSDIAPSTSNSSTLQLFGSGGCRLRFQLDTEADETCSVRIYQRWIGAHLGGSSLQCSWNGPDGKRYMLCKPCYYVMMDSENTKGQGESTVLLCAHMLCSPHNRPRSQLWCWNVGASLATEWWLRKDNE